MKSLKEVSKLLNIPESKLKRFISPQLKHRKNLDALGCKSSKEFMFTEEAILYLACNYVSDIEECWKYVLSSKNYNEKENINVKKKVIKNVKVNRS